MRDIRRSYVLIALLLVCSTRILNAGDFAAIDPAELQMKDLPEQPGASAFVLFREEVDDDLKQSRFIYERIKVLTEAGRKYGDVQIPYFISRRVELGITDVQGRTIHSDGTVVEFKGKPYDKTLLKRKGIKEQVKAFSLPDVQVGSVLEYRYTLDYHSHTVLPPRLAGPKRSLSAAGTLPFRCLYGHGANQPRQRSCGSGLQLEASQGNHGQVLAGPCLRPGDDQRAGVRRRRTHAAERALPLFGQLLLRSGKQC